MLCLFGYLLFWQVIKRNNDSSSEVKFLGIEVKSPYISAVMFLVAVFLLYTSINQINAESKVRVTDVFLSVDGRTGPNVLTWNTPCPATVRLTGSISAVGKGTVSYQFVRKIGLYGDETPGRVMTVDFSGTGTIPVIDNVTVPFPEGEYYYTDSLKIIDPGNLQSEPVGFTVWCNPNTPPPPVNMPPPPDVDMPPPSATPPL